MNVRRGHLGGLLRGIGIAAGLGVLAACGSAQVGSPDDVVSAKDVSGLERVLVDGDGMTLYVAEQEASRKIACTGGCVELWEPLTVPKDTELSSDDGLASSLSTVRRPDGGGTQVTYQGYPLYTFTEDSGAGELTGNDVTDEFGGTSFTWHAMTMEGPAPAGSPSESGGGGGYGY